MVFAFVCQKNLLYRIQIASDSKIVVDWFEHKDKLQVMALEPWQQRIRALQETFIEIKAMYTSREFNSKVDALSKETLLLDEGVLEVQHFIQGRLF